MAHSDPFRLQGRTTLITGGTRGVGAAIARSIARAGGDLVLHGLSEDEGARETVEACRQLGARTELICGDLVDSPPDRSVAPRAAELVAAALRVAPQIDGLVNNVGTYREGGFGELTAENFYYTLQLNVAAGLFITRQLVEHWRTTGCRGRIVFTGSINGLLSEPAHVCYDASKGAVAAMVRSLCVELAPLGIRVNSMAPGLVRTPLTDVINTDSEFRHWMELHTPNQTVPEADVCGPPTVFLLSDAAEHIHGQTLYVDGGMSAWQQPDRPT